jgi:hypothetical protein
MKALERTPLALERTIPAHSAAPAERPKELEHNLIVLERTLLTGPTPVETLIFSIKPPSFSFLLERQLREPLRRRFP